MARLECSHCAQVHFQCSRRCVCHSDIQAVIGCINALSATWAEVKRGVYGGALPSSAYSFHDLSESVCADPEAGSQARELFCCLWFSVKDLLLKGSGGCLDFDSSCM